MHLMKRIGPALAAMLVLGVSACAPTVTAEPGSSAPAESPAEQPPTATSGEETVEEIPESTPAQAPEEEDEEETPTAPATACEDEAFPTPAPVPDELAELDIPFYPCAHEMTAIAASDPLFVGEYETSHELIVVEMAITNQFDASDWETGERTTDGDNAITQAHKPGYTLVVALGPTRGNESHSSIHYTLREE